MENFESLSHVRWECKYHIIFIPKYRRKAIFGKLRAKIGQILRDLCQQKEVEILEAHAMPDHIHMCVAIPPKYSVSFIIGFIKGKSAVRIHRELLNVRRMTGKHFGAVGYWVSTVGRDEDAVRRYIRQQDDWDQSQGQLFD
jgi:putative transposase